MEKLQNCIKKKSIHTSHSREVIYRILLESSGCLCASEILELAYEIYPVKISINTLYRHLRLFVECDLIVAVQSDLQKAYYCYKTSEKICFSICPVCHRVEKLCLEDEMLPAAFKECDYISVHRKCQQCI